MKQIDIGLNSIFSNKNIGMEKTENDKHYKKILAAFATLRKKHSSIRKQDLDENGSSSNDYAERESKLSTLVFESCNILKESTKSTGCILYLVDNNKKEIYLYPHVYKDTQKHRVKWPICEGKTVAGHVAATKKFLMVKDNATNGYFTEGLAFENAKTAMCLPIIQPDDSCYAVVELYRVTSEPYTDALLQPTLCCLGWIGATIYETNKKYLLNKRSQLNRKLLSLLQDYFSDSVTLESTVHKILNLAKLSMFAKHSSLYIVKQEQTEPKIMMAEMFNEDTTNKTTTETSLVSLENVDTPAGFAAQTRKIINIKDVHTDPRFVCESNMTCGNHVRSNLSWPLLNNEEVLGVLSVMNKLDEGPFTEDDQELFSVFVDYCIHLIQYYKLQKKFRYHSALNAVHNTLLDRHLKPCKHDLQGLTESCISALPSGFNEFDWYLTSNYKNIASNLLFYMINKLSGDKPYDRTRLSDFILSVLQAYRDNPYHNAEHAFTFTHCMFNMIQRNTVFFKKTEIISLMISGLCHDIDHPGVNNSFLKLSKHPLAEMYSDSIIEYHHFFLTRQLILSKELFHHLPENERTEIMDHIKYNILCTDLAVHFRVKAELTDIILKDSWNWENTHHKKLIMGMMMTGCDFSGMAKAFPVVRKITASLYKEFYNQGDMEQELGHTPVSMMDKSKSSSQPADQIQFFNAIVIPCMKLIGTVLKNVNRLEELCNDVKSAWEDMDGFKGRAMVFAKSWK